MTHTHRAPLHPARVRPLELLERAYYYTGRRALGLALAPVLALAGWRFSKHYRWGTTRWHRAAYACVDTIGANRHADRLAGLELGELAGDAWDVVALSIGLGLALLGLGLGVVLLAGVVLS